MQIRCTKCLTETEIGKATKVWTNSAGPDKVEETSKRLNVVLPKSASNLTIYKYYQFVDPCSITNEQVRAEFTKDPAGYRATHCWATNTAQLAWGRIDEPVTTYNRDGTITVSVNMVNGSDCDPRKCMLVVSYY